MMMMSRMPFYMIKNKNHFVFIKYFIAILKKQNEKKSETGFCSETGFSSQDKR
jgi:hypothetical protein